MSWVRCPGRGKKIRIGLATTTLRIAVGGLSAGHGLQKLTDKFGGSGPEGTAPSFERMGFEPGKPYAMAAGVAETVGGALLATGMWTPLGAAMLTGVQATAIAKVHAKNGLWVHKGGFEYNATLIAAAFAVTEAGPGFPSIDGLVAKRRKGFGWALAELALGLGAAAVAVALSERGKDLAGKQREVSSEPASIVTDATRQTADTVAAGADSAAEAARTASS